LTARGIYDFHVVWLLCVSIRDAIASLANQDAAAPQAYYQRSFSSHFPIDWLPDFHTHFKASSCDSGLPRSSARNGPVHAGHERGRYRDHASDRAGGRIRDVRLGKLYSWSLIDLDRRQRQRSHEQKSHCFECRVHRRLYSMIAITTRCDKIVRNSNDDLRIPPCEVPIAIQTT
jgi:hypothetical protein